MKKREKYENTLKKVEILKSIDSYVEEVMKQPNSIIIFRNPSVETLSVFKEIYGVNTYITSITHLDQLYYTKLKTNELNIDYHNILFIDSPKVIINDKEFQLLFFHCNQMGN